MVVDLVTVACAGATLISGWALVCNHFTCHDRRALIAVIYRCHDWRVLEREYDRVSYDRHLLARMMFRNPRRLYARAIGERMGWPA